MTLGVGCMKHHDLCVALKEQQNHFTGAGKSLTHQLHVAYPILQGGGTIAVCQSGHVRNDGVQRLQVLLVEHRRIGRWSDTFKAVSSSQAQIRATFAM